jgi:acyl-CoA thioester hydrolase
MPNADRAFAFPVTVRYLEVDQQRVVFNMWYLAYCDEALTAFLAHRGLPYENLLAAGFDLRLVHTELDWRAGVGYGDSVEVAVSLAAVGRTSFTIDFEVRRNGSTAVSVRSVYVVVAAAGSGKRPVPPSLRSALGQPGVAQDPAPYS